VNPLLLQVVDLLVVLPENYVDEFQYYYVISFSDETKGFVFWFIRAIFDSLEKFM